MALNPTTAALADGQLSLAKTTLYTVPASTKAIVKSIILVNTNTTTSRIVQLYVNRTGTSRRIWARDYTITPKSRAEDTAVITLETGDLIEGEADAASEVDYVISGATET